MATLTPRKRKHGSASSDGLRYASASPLKKLAVDIDWTTSPIARRNTERRCVGSSARKALITGEVEKENLCSSPVKSSLPFNQLNSPVLGSAALSRQSPLQSLQPQSPFKPAVPTVSFYSKDKHYRTPLERKAQSEIKPQGRGRQSPENESPFNSRLRAPRSTLRMASRQLKALPSNPKKNKLEELPAQLLEESRPTSKIKSGVPFKVLSFTAKPRPKLILGAAFFSTGKKTHSSLKKQTLQGKPIPAAPKPLAKSDHRRKTDAEPETSRARSGTVEVLKPGISQQGLAGPPEDSCEGDLTKTGERSTAVRRKNSDYKTAALKKSDEAKPSVASSVDCPASTAQDAVILCSDSDAESSSDYEMEGNDFIVSRKCLNQDNSVHLSRKTIYPIFSTPATTKKRPPPFHEDLASPLAIVSPASTCSAQPPQEPVQQKSKRNKDAHKEAKDQMIIDAGQKHFGAVTCKSCGMIYTAASPEDETQHAHYHQSFLEGIKFVGWKRERTVADFWDGKIILILPDDPKYAIKKAEEVRELVDSELGFKQVALSCPSKVKTYMFVSNEKKIIGCLIAEPIKQAFRVLTDQIYREPQNVTDNQRAWRCSTKPEAAICGISRIWVFSLLRRKGIASRMVDTLRGSFMYGSFLSVDEIAFSDPTPDGKLFATTYCKVPNFLVYNFTS